MLRVTHELSFGALLFSTISITLGPSQCSGEGTRVNEAVLRARWEERVTTKNQKVLDQLWQDLKDERYVDVALREPEPGLEDLVQDAETRLKYWRLGGGRKKPLGRSVRTPVEVELDHYEKECAETAALYLTKKAASLPEVRRFRQEKLGGKLLTTEEAEEFLRGELQREEPDDLHSPSELDWTWIDFVDDMDLVELLEFVVPTDRTSRGLWKDLLFPYEGSEGWLGSRKKLTENYSEFCLYLAAIFPWHPYDAALFLLTGKRPEVVPLELSYNRYRRVFTLNFAPWISEKTIRKAYRNCQKVVQGGDNRRMKDRTLAVVRFVTEHTDDEGRRPLSWSQLTDLWNQHHTSEWRFKDRFGLRKAYLRAKEELAAPWH
jgi:hypothetical protein